MNKYTRASAGNCGCGGASGEVGGAAVGKCTGCYLAIASVPFQEADFSKVYSAEEALCRGTLFPELYLPFVGSGR